ncbi:hypothetical protein ACFE04_027386 [Oxalis oulophora]
MVGYRQLDCSPVYGNDKEIGDALKKLFANGLVKHEVLWITSKLCHVNDRSLSLNSVMYGSIIAGAIKSQLSTKKEKSSETKGLTEKKKRQHGSFSFLDRMQTLTDTLCKELDKDELNLNSRVLSLSYSQDGTSTLHNNWSISHADIGKNSQCSSFDVVTTTAPLSNVKVMKITKNVNIFSLNFSPQVFICHFQS